MAIDLPLVWAAIIAFGVFMYVFMDGFDLGVGILFPLAPKGADRDVMMNSVAPVWDANETWLVLGGTALFAAFPLAYAVIVSALYIPVLVMLIALIFRGVAFEFRFKSGRGRPGWSFAFHAGSLIATFAQGLILGAFIDGFAVAGRAYAGGLFDWLSAFSVMTGLGLIAGYALLGATWLVLKTDGALQAWAYRRARLAALAVVAFIVIVSVWTPLAHPEIGARWFSWPNIAYLSPVPVATAAATIALWRALARRREVAPFVLALALFALSYGGLGISLWPNVIPPSISIWQAASPPETQEFLLVGVAILIPVILGYTAYSYYVFRGKVRRGGGYH